MNPCTHFSALRLFIVFTSADLFQVSEISKEISMIGISIKMFLVVTLPVLFGMLIRKLATNFITSKTQLIQRTSVILFVIVFATIWIEERENIFSYLAQAGLVTLLLNVVMMIIAYYIAKSFATGIEQRRCIAI